MWFKFLLLLAGLAVDCFSDLYFNLIMLLAFATFVCVVTLP